MRGANPEQWKDRKKDRRYYRASMEEQKKRKTHTSSAVKQRYNSKHYKKFTMEVKFELFDRIEAYRKKENLSRAEFLQRAMDRLEGEE